MGDVNLFLNRDQPLQGELSVMIAEESGRRKGLAFEAVRLMILFGVQQKGLTSFIAKINTSNKPSIRLFEKLGFTKVSLSQSLIPLQFQEIEAFEEVHYTLESKSIEISKELRIQHYFIEDDADE